MKRFTFFMSLLGIVVIVLTSILPAMAQDVVGECAPEELAVMFGEEAKAELSRRQEKAARKAKVSAGYVYLIQSPSSAYKIGRTKSPEDRMRTFGVQLPFEVNYVCLIETPDMIGMERKLHERYAHKRVNGEWFELDLDDVDEIKQLGASNGV